MRTIILLLVIASPAFGQSHVYTNADLKPRGAPVEWKTPPPSQVVLDALAWHQFRLPADSLGPSVHIVPYDRYWPFDGPPPASRLIPDLEIYTPYVSPYFFGGAYGHPGGIAYNRQLRNFYNTNPRVAPRSPTPAPAHVKTRGASAGARQRQ